MTRPILYGTSVSPPVRSVYMAAHHLGIDLELKEVNLLQGEHLKESYVKMNPQHTVPALVDGDFVVVDSHAIMAYLANKYGKDDSIYPKDAKKRAIVDQRMFYNCGTIFTALRMTARPVFLEKNTKIPESSINLVREVYDILNKILDGKKWLAGDSFTLADFCTLPNISSISVVVPTDDHPNLKNWLKTCEKELPGYEKWNKPGNTIFHDSINQILKG